MAQETYDWSTDYSDEDSGGTTTFTATGGDTVDITVLQPDPSGYYASHGDGYEAQIQGGDNSGHFQMELNMSSNTTTASTTIDFASNTATGEDSVSNLTFTLYDLDSPSSGGYQDQVTIYAYDSNGVLLPVTLTPVDSDVVSISGSTATAIVGAGSGGSQGGNVADSSTEGNVQVQITGDVSQLVIVYGNGPGANSNPTPQQIGISDLTFDLQPAVICFARGTLIETEDGPRPVETLKPGDRVITLDHDAQPLRWVGSRKVAGRGALAPIRFAAGAVGNARPLYLSPMHRVLKADWKVEYATGHEEALVAAKHLCDGDRICPVPCAEVEYFHLMFDCHEIVYAEGTPCESLFLSATSIDAMTPDGRAEIETLFPELLLNPERFGPTARPCLRRHEAQQVI